MSEPTVSKPLLRPSPSHGMRRIKDRLTTYFMAVGGISVIIAILLIFFYLLYVVIPLFKPAGLEDAGNYPTPTPQAGKTIHLALEEQNVLAARWTDQAQVVFFNTQNGQRVKYKILNLPTGAKVTSYSGSHLADGLVVYGLSNGQALLARALYSVEHQGDSRQVSPEIEFPLGEQAVAVSEGRRVLSQITAESNDTGTTVAALDTEGTLHLARFSKESGGLLAELEEESETTITRSSMDAIGDVFRLLIDPKQRLLYVAHTDGMLSLFDISDIQLPTLLERARIVSSHTQITAIRFLTGGISLLVGSADGRVQQWFPARKPEGVHMTRVRDLESLGAAISDLVTEHRRKGLISIDARGMLAVHHTTAKRLLAKQEISDTPLRHAAISPRSNRVLMEDDSGQYHYWQVDNEHPEISWTVLWDKIWYESYEEPQYIWQSSSASNDFEPKFSLVPLVFGTLKAAFYALLFAVPLALMGAIYTAYFMAPKMRAVVKPTIEIMGALPSVILGFLAGLWLAPFVETHLPGVFTLLVALPIGVLLFAFAWQRLPRSVRGSVPDGWQAALLIPLILLVAWLSLTLSQPMEVAFFGGDMRQWLQNEMGLAFDQRNALVVGIAMGVAVIPSIFSIAEDAVFGVPSHLTMGSLALGATPWQTLTRVVILTASPGIFSAVMIGLGRAVGETMIVLMATGNTPVMDLSIFQGLRTLSANVAVEMPESEVGSTHYRILFLAALVLFMFTFVFNTLAEIVRQRLRKKYSSL